MPYNDETWTTEFVGLAVERREGRENAEGVYAF